MIADDFDQSWTLDGLGNFAEFDDDGVDRRISPLPPPVYRLSS
jgi:hypothetical protein